MRIIGLVIVIAASLTNGADGQGYSPVVGQEHPDFVLPRIDNGEPVSLSQFRGKKVLLVHFASW